MRDTMPVYTLRMVYLTNEPATDRADSRTIGNLCGAYISQS